MGYETATFMKTSDTVPSLMPQGGGLAFNEGSANQFQAFEFQRKYIKK